MMFLVGTLALSVNLTAEQMRAIPAVVIVFIVARILFWVGYRIHPLYRAFGMAATGYLNVGILALALGRYCTEQLYPLGAQQTKVSSSAIGQTTSWPAVGYPFVEKIIELDGRLVKTVTLKGRLVTEVDLTDDDDFVAFACRYPAM